MPTPLQIRVIHVAARKVEALQSAGKFNDAAYRLLLKNVAGVDSSKDLTQPGFEDVMAVLEDLGFRDSGAGGQGGTYWRDKVRDRGLAGSARMVFKIRELAKHSDYPLDRMAWKFSDGRTNDVEQLTPREAWKLIEMYKGANQRTEAKREQQPSLF